MTAPYLQRPKPPRCKNCHTQSKWSDVDFAYTEIDAGDGETHTARALLCPCGWILRTTIIDKRQEAK